MSFVYQHVQWELYMNSLFTLGPLILEQGQAGVPIGGCLSTPKSELCAISCQHMALHDDTEAFLSTVQDILQAENVQASFVIPGPSQFIPLQGQGDFVHFEGIWAHTDRAYAPDKAPHHGHICPASGIWAPREQLIVWVTIDGTVSRLSSLQYGMAQRWVGQKGLFALKTTHTMTH